MSEPFIDQITQRQRFNTLAHALHVVSDQVAKDIADSLNGSTPAAEDGEGLYHDIRELADLYAIYVEARDEYAQQTRLEEQPAVTQQ